MTYEPGSPAWRRDEVERLLGFAAGARAEHGFGWLDDDGAPTPSDLRDLWVNARMTYVFATAHRLGLGSADAAGLAAHGLTALTRGFADAEHGGWYRQVGPDGPTDPVKACYEHAFVLLAACAAADAGVPGGAELMERAASVHLAYFWDEAAGACREEWSADWAVLERYRGANANMHTVEAYLAAAHTTGDPAWLARAAAIVERVVGVARDNGWRIVEHFDEHWRALPEHHRDRPADPFRPYGSTPGHGFEWARLLVQLHVAGRAARVAVPALDDARALFDRAAADGLGYTVDWDGHPVVAQRFHWVLCEALLAADALAAVTPDDDRYQAHAQEWWALADRAFVDHERGSWRHELGPDLAPASTTWRGKPDAYHAFNALVLAR